MIDVGNIVVGDKLCNWILDDVQKDITRKYEFYSIIYYEISPTQTTSQTNFFKIMGFSSWHITQVIK
jgi:hypothetical protein